MAGQHVTGEGSLFDVPPAAIGRFRVLHQVGAGTCGPVFRATDPERGRTVAIKLFLLNLTPERAAVLEDCLERLVSQAPPLASAVTPVAAGQQGNTPYLVTTFASGDSLDVALRQFGPAALEDLVPRLRALADALDGAAAHGILHGALHPRDVLVSEHGTTLTGLGVWPILAGLGVRLPARRPYRAPELTDASVSAAADQFALAALAYEWMTGRRAPALFGPADMAPLSGADHDRMAQVFTRALNASPDERYPACAEFVAAVADVAAGAETATPPAASRPRRRPRPAPPIPSLEEFPVQPATGTLPLGLAADDVPSETLDVAPHDRAEVEEDLPPAHPATDGDRAGTDLVTRQDAGAAEGLEAVSDAGRLLMRPQRASSPASDGAPRPPGPGMGRIAAGALVGLLLGVGLGYGVWGRGNAVDVVAPPTGAGAPADTRPASPPVTPPAPTTSPEAGAAGGASSPPAESGTPAGQPGAGAGRAPQELPVPTPSVGRVLVRSTPAGATVFVDGERRGMTPATLRDLALGTRLVRLQRDGYTTETLQVTLTRDRPSRSVDLRLRPEVPAGAAAPTGTPAVKTGTLLIESRPSGATALVNGRSVGATPVTIEDLAPGSYTVQLQLAGFRPFTTTVRVVAGARARAAGSLTGAQEPK